MIEPDSRYQRSRFTTLRDWLGVGFRRRRVIVLSFCGVFLASILFAWFWAAHYYEATMQVLVTTDRSDPTITPQPNSMAPNMGQLITPDQINSEMALLKGDDTLRQVVTNCGLYKRAGLLDFALPRDPEKRKLIKVAKETKRLSAALDVEVEKQADVIDVTYGRKGPPSVPACVLDNLSKLYLEKHLQVRRPQGSLAFFTQETERYQQALKKAEARLSNFGPSEGVVSPDVERSLMAQKLVNAADALNQAKQAIAEDHQRMSNLEAQLAATPARSTTQEQTEAASLLLQQLQANLLTAELKRSELAMKYDPKYPLVQEADKEIAQTKAAIAEAEQTQLHGATTDRDPGYELLREDLMKTKADLATQNAAATALTRTIQSERAQTVELDQDAVKQEALLRDQKASEANYLLYLAKREDARASDALDSRRIDNVTLSVPPTVPVLPAYNPLLVVLLGLVLAFFVSIAAAFVAEYLDPSFRTPAEVIETLKIPVVASVPKRAA